ncbi:MAG TPA: 2OG-Fe(II) oxygenase family protein [Thermohalobaculum sp.]|nr:2OG-Fe(II) oxygenase family protein [Thermohalobaculum sp.]
MSFDIRTVSYTDPRAPAAFARSLRETGFAVLTDHPVAPERIERTYALWGAFFASDEKHAWTREPGSAEGYFPFRSENAKDAKAKDLKEFFHVYPGGRVPPELAEHTLALHRDLALIGRTLLGWIQQNTPDEVRARFSEPLPEMLENSKQNLLRILHYPALDAPPAPGEERAAAHGDINLITLLLTGTEPGLQARDTKGDWHDVPCDAGMMAINAGDMLEMASGGYYPSTVHRVVNPPASRNVARFSMPMFCHPRPEVELKPGTTADDFLQERLREIGLKS